MKPWVELYQQHAELRSMNDRAAANDVRRVLGRLSERPYAVLRHQAPSRLIEANDRQRRCVTYTLGRDRGGEDLDLIALPEHVQREVALERARLTVLLRFDRRADRLQELAVMLTGTRPNGTTCAIAVHLPHDGRTDAHPRGDMEGLGACGHAALHCHIGATLDEIPKARVPLPALRPAQIVEWVMSQVVPTPEFEPAPWSDVEPMLRRS